MKSKRLLRCVGSTALAVLSLMPVRDLLDNTPSAYAEEQSADSPSPWAADIVTSAIALGLVPEHLQNNYTKPITRGEFCAIVAKLYEKITGMEITTLADFTDTDDINIRKIGGLGIVIGTGDGSFNPNGELNREQMALISVRLLSVWGENLEKVEPDYADLEEISTWAREGVGQAQAGGIMVGVGGQ